jgi:hypothetical protein
MQADDGTDKQRCLCCSQFVDRGMPIASPGQAEAALALLEAIGFTRESLLTKHRKQIDFQMPGFAEWLQGQ